MNENPQSNNAWEDRLTWFESSPEYRALDKIDGEPMEFEWNIFPGFTTLQLVREVQEFLSRLSVEPENFIGRIIFMSMFNDISWGSKDNEKECESSVQLVSLYAKRFLPGQWSFFGLGSKKKWSSTHEYNPQGEWDRVAEQMMLTNICRKQTPNLPIHESIIQRSAQEQRWWKIVNTLLCRWRDG